MIGLVAERKAFAIIFDTEFDHLWRNLTIDADQGGLRMAHVHDYSYDGIMRSYEQSHMRLGMNRIDLLVIHDGEIERMLPLVDQFVTNIDVAAGIITVDPPEGLPEDRIKK